MSQPEPGAEERAVDRHPHLARPLPQGWVRVDMHSHTMWSGDSTTTPDEIEDVVAESGIDVLCITDHNSIAGAVELAGRLPCRVIVGEELRTAFGEIIGLFLTERIPFGVSAEAAAGRIREQGGVVYVPHPFDPTRSNLRGDVIDELTLAGLIDVIEVHNAKTGEEHLNARAAAYALDNGLLAGAGSDAHVPAAIGAAYVEMPDFDGPDEFKASLAQGVVVGHHFDRARPWKSRIIPSVNSH